MNPPPNQKPEPGARDHCRQCGEEIRYTGRRWAHEAHYPDGHEAAPLSVRYAKLTAPEALDPR
jgi:hypothetical protein